MTPAGDDPGERPGIRVAGGVIPTSDDVATNEAHILDAVDRAAADGADLLLTPEGALSGYGSGFVADRTMAALRRVRAQAARAGIGLALGTCVRLRGKNYNQIRWYTRTGDFVGAHSKIMLCGRRRVTMPGDFDETEFFHSRPLRVFEYAGLTIGGLICNDLWQNPLCTPRPGPELLKRIASKGASVVFHAVNTGYAADDDGDVHRAFHESNLRLRARAAGVPIVTVDACDPEGGQPSNAPSGILDGEGSWLVGPFFTGPRVFVGTVPGYR